jgi:hypothetical protein
LIQVEYIFTGTGSFKLILKFDADFVPVLAGPGHPSLWGPDVETLENLNRVTPVETVDFTRTCL